MRKIISLIVSAVMVLSLAIMPAVNAEQAPGVSRTDAGEINIVYSQAVSDTTGFFVRNESGYNMNCAFTAEGTVVKADISSLENGEYYLITPEAVYTFKVNKMDKAGKLMTKGAYAFTAKEAPYGLDGDDSMALLANGLAGGEKAEYEVFDKDTTGTATSVREGYENKKTYYVKSDRKFVTYDENSENYAGYKSQVLEFDYANGNYTTARSNSNYSGLYLFFRNNGVQLCRDTDGYHNWQTWVKGASYVMPIEMNTTDSVKLGLYKFDGTDTVIKANFYTGDGFTKLQQIKDAAPLNPGEKIRFKVLSENVGETSVKISVYYAKYEESGNLTEFTKAFEITDSDNPYLSGTYYFGYAASANFGTESNPNLIAPAAHFAGNFDFEETDAPVLYTGEVPDPEAINLKSIDYDFLTGKVNVSFSNEPKESTLEGNINLVFNGVTYPLTATLDQNTASCDIPAEVRQKDGDFSVSISKDIESTYGRKLPKSYEKSFTRTGLHTDFADSTQADVWGRISNDTGKSITSYSKTDSYSKPIVVDGKMIAWNDMALKDSSGNSTTDSSVAVKSGNDFFAAPIPAKDYSMSGNSVFEFDFERQSLVDAENHFAAFVRVEEMVGTGSNDTYVNSKGETVTNTSKWNAYVKNAYAVRIHEYGDKYKKGINGTGANVPDIQIKKFTTDSGPDSTVSITKGTTLKSASFEPFTASKDDEVNTKYRLRFTIEDIKDSDSNITAVKLSVYIAEYNAAGTLGDWVKYLEYTDSDSPITSGFFGFGQYRNMEKYAIGNVVYESEGTSNLVLDNEDVLKQWAEKRIAKTGKSSLNFVAFGGSITEGGTIWTTKVKDYMENASGVKFNMINSGVGGTGSDYGIARFDTDVISKNPDVVFIDHSVNDGSLIASYTNGNVRVNMSVRNTETEILRLLDMENPPMIVLVDFTTMDLLKKDIFENPTKQAENNTAGYYKNDYVLVKDKLNYLAGYYGIPVIDIHDYIKQAASVDESGTAQLDYSNGIFSGYGFDSTVTDGGIQLLGDKTHPTSKGYELYGDYMVKCLKTGSNTKFKDITKPAQTFVADSNTYASGLKDIVLTPEEIKNSDRFEVTGNPEIVANIPENRTGMRTLNSQELVGVIIKAGSEDATLSYSFNGSQFLAYTGTQSQDYKPSATVDQSTYNANTTMISYSKYPSTALTNGNYQHKYTMTVPAGQSVTLMRIVTAEDTNYYSVAEKNGKKYITVDLADQANGRGSLLNGDVTLNPWNSDTGKCQSWIDLMNYGTTADFMDYTYLSNDWIMNKVSNGNLNLENADAVYNANIFNNRRLRAVVAADKFVNVGNVSGTSVKILGAAGKKGTSYVTNEDSGYHPEAFNITLRYSDGTEVVKAIDLTNLSENALSGEEGVRIVAYPDTYFALGSSSVMTGYGRLLEVTLNIDKTKTLTGIKFSDSRLNAYDRWNTFGISIVSDDKVAFSNVKSELKSSEGYVKSDLVAGDEMTYLVDVVSNGSVSATPMLAVYDNEGNLYDVVIGTKLNASEGKYTGNAKFKVPSELPDGYTYKVMLWDGLSNIKPLMR